MNRRTLLAGLLALPAGATARPRKATRMSIFTVSKDSPAQQIYQNAWGPGLLVNLSTEYPLYIGIGTTNVTASNATLPPGATMAVTGGLNIYASTLDKNITVSVQALPGVTSWTAAPSNLQLETASYIQAQTTDSPVILVSMPFNGRIWAVSLACTIVTDSGYTPARNQAYASVLTHLVPNPDVTLLIADVGISGPTQYANQALSIDLPGFYVEAGTEIELDINAGGGIAGATIEASATVVYSIP
jgi:hypothetical protein